MSPRRPTLVAIVGLSLAAACLGPASAQIKPASSGALSYNAPEMRRHGSGFHRPNRPHHHRHRRHHHHHHGLGRIFR